MSRWTLWLRRAYPTSRSGTIVPSAGEKCFRLIRIVRSQSMSACRGRPVRPARSSAPVTAARVRSARRFSRSATTRPTTSRAVCLVSSGITSFSASSVLTRWTSGSTAFSSSGSISIRVIPSRSTASRCIT
jgi:hypothetical protein